MPDPIAPSTAEDVTAAAQLLRDHGYSVVTAVQAEMWERWLRESHEREHEAHEATARHAGEVTYLLDRCAELLNGSRPRWYREARRRWNDLGWHHRPIVPVDPRRKVASRA